MDIQVSVRPIPAVLLLNTPTLIVPMETLNTFVANDFPLIIATDHDGIVRYIRPASDNALVEGGLIDQIAGPDSGAVAGAGEMRLSGGKAEAGGRNTRIAVDIRYASYYGDRHDATTQ